MEYDWKQVQAPILRGWALYLFSFLTKTPLWGLICRVILRKSGFPQALREQWVADAPVFTPPCPLTLDATDATLCISLSTSSPFETTVVAAKAPVVASALKCVQNAVRSRGVRPGILEYHAAYKSGGTDPVAVAQRILDFIDTHNARTTTHSLCWFLFYGVGTLDAAAASRRRWQRGEPLSVFDGVPFAVKDNQDTAYYPTCAGTTFLAEQRETPGDGPAVAALRALGAVLIGKTVMHELGMSTLGINPHHGISRNPWNRNCLCGGSSSGSAAAVGSGLVAFSIAGDAGGSLRVPAALCGASALMPTHSRLSPPGPSIAPSVSVSGPIATSAADAALVYAAIADSGTAPLRLPRLGPTAATRGLRVGVYRPWFNDCSLEVRAACEAAVETLVNIGATLVDVCIPDLDLCRVAHTATVGAEVVQSFGWVLNDAALRDRLGPDVNITLSSAAQFTGAEYVQAARIRGRMAAHMRLAFEAANVIVTPTTPSTAPTQHADAACAGESNLPETSRLMKYMQLGNLLGLPAVVVPCGVDASGLPISLQVFAPAWHEASLLAIAHALETSPSLVDCTWHDDLRVRCNPLEASMLVR